jgi:hypothetical protein
VVLNKLRHDTDYETPTTPTINLSYNYHRDTLLGGRRVLGDGLGTLRDGVLGEFSGKDESDGSLDLSGRDGGSVVVRCELGGFAGDSLKDIRDERVEDSHGFVTVLLERDLEDKKRRDSRDTSVGVDLLEDLVDVRRVGLDPLLGPLLSTLGLGSGGLCGLNVSREHRHSREDDIP